MNVFSVCAFAAASCIAFAPLKILRPEYFKIAFSVVGAALLLYVVSSLSGVVSFISDISSDTAAKNYIPLMLKALAVSVCCRASAEICKDCGEESLSTSVLSAGKVSIVLLTLPTVKNLLELAKDMLV